MMDLIIGRPQVVSDRPYYVSRPEIVSDGPYYVSRLQLVSDGPYYVSEFVETTNCVWWTILCSTLYTGELNITVS